MLPMFMQKPFDVQYFQHIKRLFGTALIGYWPLDEAAGASTVTDYSGQANNGTPSNVTFGQAGIGDGRTSGSFDGTTGYVDAFSAGLATDFSGTEGTFACWAKVSAAGVWTDGAFRVLLCCYTDANNYVIALRHSTNNIIYSELKCAGISVVTFPGADSGGTLNWFHIASTWSASGDSHKFYFNGTSYSPGGAATWSGALAEARFGSAEATSGLSKWSGYLAHAILLNTAATPAQIAESARVSV